MRVFEGKQKIADLSGPLAWYSMATVKETQNIVLIRSFNT